MMTKAMAMASLLLLCNGELWPSVASTHAATRLHKPGRREEAVPARSLLFQPFIIISQPKTTRRRQTSSRRSEGEAKLLGVPASPHQAVAAERPRSIGDRLRAARGSRTRTPRQDGPALRLPWASLAGTAPLPSAEGPAPPSARLAGGVRERLLK